MGTITHKILEAIARPEQSETRIYPQQSVNSIIQSLYDHYIKGEFSSYTWTDTEFSKIKSWVWRVLEFNDGAFSPLKRDIVAAEPFFDLQVADFSIKGTIDLITKVDDHTGEVTDYKTGRRLDWATMKEKTFEKMKTDDIQPRMYHLAVCKLYPEFHNWLITFFYINDGGPFTICFTKNDISKTERMLRDRFEEIRNTRLPTQRKTWKCSKFCKYGKSTFADTHIKPIHEFREGQTCEFGHLMTKCEQCKFEMDKNSIDFVTNKYTWPGFSVNKYSND
jgi:hypothetical protein